MRYDERSSLHRPGLNFFEYITRRAQIQVASTLVFLEAEAARRVSCTVYMILVLSEYYHNTLCHGHYVLVCWYFRFVVVRFVGAERSCMMFNRNGRLNLSVTDVTDYHERVVPLELE